MTSKKLISLTAAATVLVAAAYFSANRNTVKTPQRLGQPVLNAMDLSRIAAIDIENETGETIALHSTEKGWVVDNLYGYPANITRIREAVLKLDQLKVGDLADTSRLGNTPGHVTLKDEAGTALAKLTLGTKRMRAPDEAMAAYGGGPRPDGRYIAVDKDPSALLVSDALEVFDADAKHWIETQLTSIPASNVAGVTITQNGDTLSLPKMDGAWTLDGLADDEQLDMSAFHPIESALSYLNLTSVVDPQRTPDELGLTTGTVFKATLNNGEYYTATIGNTIENGTDRYLKLEAGFAPAGTNEIVNAAAQQKVDIFNADRGPWTFSISSYNAEQMMKIRTDFLKAIEPEEEEKAIEEPASIEPETETESTPEPAPEAEVAPETITEVETTPEATTEPEATPETAPKVEEEPTSDDAPESDTATTE